jgi:hypothetical protein
MIDLTTTRRLAMAGASYPAGASCPPMLASGVMRSLTRGLGRAAIPVALAMAIAGCGVVSTTAPAPTPADFQGIATELSKRDIVIEDLVSGDAGCDDPVLIPTAIGLTASGLDQADPVRLRIYIFRNREAFERLRATVDTCAMSFVTDPSTYETVEQSPFVIAAQGPWAPDFEAAIRDALEVAAGTGN